MQQDWRAATPQYSEFQSILDNYANTSPRSFIEMQPRLGAALSKFDALDSLTRVLLVNAPDNAIYRQLICESLKECNKPVVRIESLSVDNLFGRYQLDSGEIKAISPGYLQQAESGYLVVSANMLLANPRCWSLLKSALLGEAVEAINVNDKQLCPTPPKQNYQVKLIVVGDRTQMGDLEYFDHDFTTGFSMFSEIELEYKLDGKTLPNYLGYLQWLTERFSLVPLESAALETVLAAGARESEDQRVAPLCLLWYNALLAEAAIESSESTITQNGVKQAIEQKYYRESYLTLRAVDDILDGQVIIETKGEQVGQVNGLTVVDIPGHPISYGEPARISCVIHFGDGDISDVERKADLGGNLHAKGMMIMQAFLSSAMNLDEPLPYSASIVFEQSYCEVDGDSASLAELCCLVSALSEQPINQQIAVTGAVDQFGRIQAVGGLNEKIEGFFHVCQHQGLTGEQGVILPQTNLKHLALHDDVIEAIKTGQFHLWSAETVDDAIPLLMGKPLRGEEEDTLLNRIANRIDEFERDAQPNRLIDRIKQWFDHN
ncbi:Lon protease family protein [Vibrio sp. SCSIO 43136]|uniref:AAA family ATPase n=1 Tax=Vibrio sp. SCSIO 43136 TaxID=2819101 RepID=UPI00207611AE|nr:Lon protease family protein [Vibrio sp. SCSIO 43136]USD66537.1 Lon protease family protein [Vibrio sp. SCSIO 43136]